MTTITNARDLDDDSYTRQTIYTDTDSSIHVEHHHDQDTISIFWSNPDLTIDTVLDLLDTDTELSPETHSVDIRGKHITDDITLTDLPDTRDPYLLTIYNDTYSVAYDSRNNELTIYLKTPKQLSLDRLLDTYGETEWTSDDRNTIHLLVERN